MKEAYYLQAIDDVKDWNSRIEELEGRADGAEPEARIEFRRKIDPLRTQLQRIEEKIQKLRDMPEKGWEAVRPSIDQAFSDLKTAYESVAARLQ